MKVRQTVFEMEPVNGFEEIYIFEDDKGFRIGYTTTEKLGVIEFSNCFVGAWNYAANKDYIEKRLKYFDSYQQAISAIEEKTEKEMNKIFEGENELFKYKS